MSGNLITNEAEGDPGILSDLRTPGDVAPSGPELTGLSSRRRRINTQSLVLALVLTASAGSLYMMRKQGMGVGIHFDPKQVNLVKELEDIRKPTTPAQQRIYDELTRGTVAPFAAPRDPLHKNPFVLPGDEKVKGPAEPPTARQREAEILAALGTIQLHGVMQGPVPLARVNTKLVRVGDRLENIFMVAQIHDRSIELIADGQTYTLNMGEGAANPTKPNPRPPAAPPRR